MLATSVRAIRYYEEEGLLEPIRTKGGTRLYSERHLDRLRTILFLAKNGLSLASIRAIGQARENCMTGKESSQQVTMLLDNVLADIELKASELKKLQEEILLAKQIIKKCSFCTNIPNSEGCPDCPVRNYLVSIKILSLIWDNG